MRGSKAWWIIALASVCFILLGGGFMGIKRADDVVTSSTIQRAGTWKVKGSGKMGERAVLSLKARIDSATLAGHTNSMVLYVSDQKVDSSRLINKDLVFQTENGTVSHWYARSGWRLLYSPDYGAADEGGSPYSVIGGKAYQFVFDVTDLIKKDGTAQIKIENNLWDRYGKSLVIGDMKLEFLSLDDFNARFGPWLPSESDGELKIITPKKEEPIDYRLEVLPNGSLEVEFQSLRLKVNSLFSSPEGVWYSDNFLTEGEESGEISGQCQEYRVIRRVIKGPGRIDIKDEITNLTREDVGIIIKNQVTTFTGDAQSFKPEKLYLQGIKMPAGQGETSQPANPTVFWTYKDMGVGLVPVDDVYRVHSSLYYYGDTAGISDSSFVIGSGGTYEMKWSIYLVPSHDYYDFINNVRRDLGVNFTIDGFSAFFRVGKTPMEYLKWLDVTGVKYPLSMISGAYKDGTSQLAHGSAFLNQSGTYRGALKNAIRLLSTRPDIYPLVYFHAQICTEDGAQEKYKDSRVLFLQGNQASYSSGLPLFYATLENSYGRELLKYADVVMDELGASGIYWDEMSYSRYPYTYDTWDGHSGDIDPDTLQLVRKKGHVALLTQPFKEAFIKRVQEKGGLLIANSAPVTDTMTKFHIPRFIETGSMNNLTRAHLSSPIGLGDHLSEKRPEDVYQGVLEHLKYGCIYYCYNQVPDTSDNILKRMYPITPIEIHEGYILGEERIITSISGVYGWDDDSKLTVYYYNRSGRPEKRAFKTLNQDGKTYVEVILEGGECAIIERGE